MIPWARRLGGRLEQGRLIWTAAVLPLFVFAQGRLLPVGCAILGALWLAAGAAGRRWGRRSPVDGCLLVWLLLVPVTLAVTATPSLTQEHLGLFLAELIAFYAVLTWATTAARVRLVAWGLVGCGVALAALTLTAGLHSGRLALPAALLRALPFTLQDTVNKNVLGGSLAVLLPLSAGVALGQPWRGRGIAHGLIAVGGLALMAAGLAVSQSRGAYLGAAAGLGLMAVLRWRPARWAALAGGAGLLLLAWSGRLAPLLGEVLRFDTLGGPAVRVEVWTRALYALHDFPFTGIGLGGFPRVIPALYPYPDDAARVIPHAHNIFLQVGVDLGLPGLLAFVAFMLVVGTVGAGGWLRLRRGGAPALAGIALGGLGALTALLVHGQVDAVTWGTKPAALAWATLALLLAAGLQPRPPCYVPIIGPAARAAGRPKLSQRA